MRRDGSPYMPGDWISDSKLAATLQRLADDPSCVGSFYNGSLAQDIVHDIAKAGEK